MTDLTDEAVKALPHEIQVWRSMDALDHIGTWATTRYPAEAVTYVSKADAQAAVALALEEAVEAIKPKDVSGDGRYYRIPGFHKEGNACHTDSLVVAVNGLVDIIRRLAPADGLAAVEALRVEARENAMQALASMGQAQEAYEAQLEAEAELARVKADAAAAQALMLERVAA